MTDLLQTIVPKSDQTNADDLIGKTLTIKITKVLISGGDQPVLIHYEGDQGKPYKPCKSMRRVLVQVWGADGAEYVGRSLTLFRDPSVKWAGAPVGGIRISHMSHIDKPVVMALTETKGSRKPYTVKPLVAEKAAPKQDEPSHVLIAAGEAHAALGIDAYKAWTQSLSAEEKKAIRPKHAEWLAIANEAPDREPGQDG